MLQFLPSFIVGIIAIILYGSNFIFIPLLIIIVSILRLLLPFVFWTRWINLVTKFDSRL